MFGGICSRSMLWTTCPDGPARPTSAFTRPCPPAPMPNAIALSAAAPSTRSSSSPGWRANANGALVAVTRAPAPRALMRGSVAVGLPPAAGTAMTVARSFSPGFSCAKPRVCSLRRSPAARAASSAVTSIGRPSARRPRFIAPWPKYAAPESISSATPRLSIIWDEKSLNSGAMRGPAGLRMLNSRRRARSQPVDGR